MKHLLFPFAILLGFIYSCSNDLQDMETLPEHEIQKRTCFTASSGFIDSFGIMHNIHALGIIGELSCEGTIATDLENAIYSYYVGLGRDSEYINNMIADYDDAVNFDITDYSGIFDDYSTVLSYYNDIIFNIDTTTYYSDLATNFAAIRADAITNLDCFDRDFVVACANLGRGSAKMWMSTSVGGEYIDVCEQANWHRECIDEAIVADVAGLAYAMAELAWGMWIPDANILIGAMCIEYAAVTSTLWYFNCDYGTPNSGGGGSW